MNGAICLTYGAYDIKHFYLEVRDLSLHQLAMDGPPRNSGLEDLTGFVCQLTHSTSPGLYVTVCNGKASCSCSHRHVDNPTLLRFYYAYGVPHDFVMKFRTATLKLFVS